MRRAKPGNMCTDGPTRLAAKQAFGDAIKSVFSAENLGCRCIAPTIVRPKQLAHLDHIYIYTYIYKYKRHMQARFRTTFYKSMLDDAS